MRTDATRGPQQLTADQEAKFNYAAALFRQAFEEAIHLELYGEVVARIPVNGPKGPGRAIADFRKTFV